jgi:hypothetical protein
MEQGARTSTFPRTPDIARRHAPQNLDLAPLADLPTSSRVAGFRSAGGGFHFAFGHPFNAAVRITET